MYVISYFLRVSLAVAILILFVVHSAKSDLCCCHAVLLCGYIKPLDTFRIVLRHTFATQQNLAHFQRTSRVPLICCHLEPLHGRTCGTRSEVISNTTRDWLLVLTVIYANMFRLPGSFLRVKCNPPSAFCARTLPSLAACSQYAIVKLSSCAFPFLPIKCSNPRTNKSVSPVAALKARVPLGGRNKVTGAGQHEHGEAADVACCRWALNVRNLTARLGATRDPSDLADRPT